MLTYEGNTIVYRERQLPILLRLFIIVIALGVGVGIPVPFIIHAPWTTPSPVVIFAAACVILPAAAGAFMLLIALVSATELRLDPATRRAWRRLRGPIVNKDDSFDFADIPPPDVRMKDSEDGPFPILRLTLPGWRRFVEMACFRNRAEADFWCDRITRILSD